MMKAEDLVKGLDILIALDEIGQTNTKTLKEKIKIEDEKILKEIIKYLKEKGYVEYSLALFINDTFIGEDKVRITNLGREVVLGQREYFENSTKVQHQTNIYDSQIAQTTGDYSPIIQINNSQISVLKQLIEKDEELDEDKKTKLFGILEKFNTLKESGQNALELIKNVGGIATKYIPLFFSLLS